MFIVDIFKLKNIKFIFYVYYGYKIIWSYLKIIIYVLLKLVIILIFVEVILD